MEKNENQLLPPPVERRSFFGRYALGIKIALVGFLTLLLLIPLSMIESLIRERKSSHQEAVVDITSKWGREQTITGPLLVVPYMETVEENRKKIDVLRNLLVLPDRLSVEAKTAVETRKRGIYDASVYGSEMAVSGEFDLSALKKSMVDESKILWDETRVILGLSDLKGIKETVVLQSNGHKINFESGLPVEDLLVGGASGIAVAEEYGNSSSISYSNTIFQVGVNAKLDSAMLASLSMEKKMPFSIDLKINGSQGMYITPVGKSTSVNMQSDWATPKFDGEFLPAHREVETDGFIAEWKVFDLNRSYGQVVKADNQNAINQMAGSRFGVQFIQSVDQYQQNMRSVKYAILIILLTFVVVFFIELLQKKSVNPFQYLLVGVALVLFYSLLLSMSEVWGFNKAYVISALMTTVLITIHMVSILKNRKQGFLIGALLAFLYIFIFILIQMESYALLVGSLGLFAILAVIMYFSKKVKF